MTREELIQLIYLIRKLGRSRELYGDDRTAPSIIVEICERLIAEKETTE